MVGAAGAPRGGGARVGAVAAGGQLDSAIAPTKTNRTAARVPTSATISGLPINDAARLFADSWDASRLTLQEHQCRVHVAPYIYHGPLNLRIWEEKDPGDAAAHRDQELHQHLRADAHHLDGRPPASVRVRAAHLHGLLHRHVGRTHADRHHHAPQAGLAAPQRRARKRPDDAVRALHRGTAGTCTHTVIITDPVYLAEPLIRTTDFALSDADVPNWRWPCEYVEEITGRAKGDVPHYLPGENPYLQEFVDRTKAPAGGRHAAGPTRSIPSIRRSSPPRRVAPRSAGRGASHQPGRKSGQRHHRSAPRPGQRVAAGRGRRQRRRAGGTVGHAAGGLEVGGQRRPRCSPRPGSSRWPGSRSGILMNTQRRPRSRGRQRSARQGPGLIGRLADRRHAGRVPERRENHGARQRALARERSAVHARGRARRSSALDKEVFFNGEPVLMQHVPAAHTDGDSIVVLPAVGRGGHRRHLPHRQLSGDRYRSAAAACRACSTA